jgi:hypothetical protein
VSVKVPDETPELDISNLTRFFPVNVLTHLDRVIAEATKGLPKDTFVCVWIVTDDSSIPVHIKEETRAQRKHYTKKRLETARADTVSYKDVDRIYPDSLSFTDGRISHLPIVADVFCSKDSRPFRIKFVEWLIDQSQYFRWTNAANLQLNFVAEGVKPVGVIPVTEENKHSSSSSHRESVVFPLNLPLKLCAEADVFIQHLVRYIAVEASAGSKTGSKLDSTRPANAADPYIATEASLLENKTSAGSKLDSTRPANAMDPYIATEASLLENKPGRPEIIVNAVDSDICALLIAWTMDHYAHKKTADHYAHEKTYAEVEVPRIDFFRFCKDKKNLNRPVMIDVDALARFFLFDRSLPAAAFLGGCILTGTDFFQKVRIFCGLGSSYVLDGIIAISDKLGSPFSVENKAHFEQLLVAAILSKENRLDLFIESYNQSLDSVRNWFVLTTKKIPKYVPDKSIYETLTLRTATEESKTDEPSGERQEQLISSYRKIPAVFTKGHHWPTKDAGARSIYRAFLDNYYYWAPSVLHAAPLQESSRIGSPIE